MEQSDYSRGLPKVEKTASMIGRKNPGHTSSGVSTRPLGDKQHGHGGTAGIHGIHVGIHTGIHVGIHTGIHPGLPPDRAGRRATWT
eukprot:629456-Pyramimonas_sp.AAC.2